MWVALAAAGILGLADYSGGSLDPLGVAFALAAGALWAAYIVLSQRTGAVFPGGSGLAIAMVAGAVLVAPFGIADAGAELLQPELLGALLAVALASSVLPYSLELEALRRLPAARVRRADVARARGRRAGRLRRARPGPRARATGSRSGSS